MATSSIRKTTAGFEIQTRDVRNPPEALIGPLKCNVDTRSCGQQTHDSCPLIKRFS